MEINYCLLSDLNSNLRVYIDSLATKKSDIFSTQRALFTQTKDPEFFVTATVYSNGTPIGLPASTSYTTVATNNEIKWKEWISLEIKYRDLIETSQIAFTIWEVSSTATTTTTSEIVQTQASTSLPSSDALSLASCTSSSKIAPIGGSTFPLFTTKGLLQVGKRQLQVWEDVEADGRSPSATPSNATAKGGYDTLEKCVRENETKPSDANLAWLDRLSVLSIEKTRQTYHAKGDHWHLFVELPDFKFPVAFHQKSSGTALADILPIKQKDRLFVLHDPDVNNSFYSRGSNPAAMKYSQLIKRSRGAQDRALIPAVAERNKINEILRSPNQNLTNEERILLWKFRYVLIKNKKALTKFLRCVVWSNSSETKQALELMEQWEPIEIADALELLSRSYTEDAYVVRKYAVTQLKRADNEEIVSYLLQLIQALKYEHDYPSDLSTFILSRAIQGLEIANFLYWFATVETEDKVYSKMYQRFITDFEKMLQAKPETNKWLGYIKDQTKLIKQLMSLCETLKASKLKVEKKTDLMRQLLSPNGEYAALREFSPVCNLVRPEQRLCGIIPEESILFKSAMSPLLACFRTSDGGKLRIIFKNGDDLRQDQLVIQMINLMDSLLKKVNLDLRLTPYRVLATGVSHGFVEFVPDSHTVTSILQNYERNIYNFIQKHNSKAAKLQPALDNFLKSCAGYCVITYILGIGDRHLDNVLITSDGHLFHIDFGYCFGRDPKPFPPPMKFSREMIDAMGGANSVHYFNFRKHCVSAFNILRGNANLILNLLSLMMDANIPDLSNEVGVKNILKVQEKFRLDLEDDAAGEYILQLIDSSARALMPQIIDKFHDLAQAMK